MFWSNFVYSFNRLLDQKIASPGSWIFKNVREFEAVNDTVLKIKLKNKSNSFLGKLAMKYSSVLPFESWNEDKQLNKEYKQLSQKDQDKLLNYLYIKYLRYLD